MSNFKEIEEHHRLADEPPKYQETQHINSDSNPGYPTQSGYQSPQSNPIYIPQPQNVVYVQAAPQVLMLRDQPQHCVCPNCRANILTQLKYDSGVAAWLIAGGLCLFGLGCGCCLIPFCLDACKDVEHYCPNCRAMIGRYKRI